VHFGLGPQTRVETVEIFWPDRKQQLLHDIAADQLLAVREPN
jgi:hypothetical protein